MNDNIMGIPIVDMYRVKPYVVPVDPQLKQYSIDELCDIHDKEFYPHKGATSAVSFLDWLREREK